MAQFLDFDLYHPRYAPPQGYPMGFCWRCEAKLYEGQKHDSEKCFPRIQFPEECPREH